MKVINIILIIIFILAVLFIFKAIYLNQETNNLQIEQIKELINKSENINNYSLTTNNDKDTKIKYKEGKFVFEKDNNKIFINYEDNDEKAIIITEKNKTAIKIKKENFTKIDTIKTSKENLYYIINNYEKYKINGEEIFNGYKCISLTTYSKYYASEGWNFEQDVENYNGKTIESTVLIDKNTGVIMKITSKIEDKETINEYYYKFNCVTEEEVTAPDLSKYKIKEIN